MIVLVIDTSLQGLTIGLVEITGESHKILELYGSSHPQEAAAKLPELCQKLLQKQNLVLKNVTDLLVSHGPGSFTGIKIGLSFASGWKRAGTPIRIWAVSAFGALLQKVPEVNTLVLPATQTAGYLAQRSDISLKSSVQFGVLDLSYSTVASIQAEGGVGLSPLQPNDLEHVAIFGPWPRMEAWLSSEQISWGSLVTASLHNLIVDGMVEDFIANSAQLSEGKLEPIYLRKSAPEEKLDGVLGRN